jgi:hypothetical protein
MVCQQSPFPLTALRGAEVPGTARNGTDPANVLRCPSTYTELTVARVLHGKRRAGRIGRLKGFDLAIVLRPTGSVLSCVS